jgi:lipid-binding SYLF domain-containing protein
MSKKRFTVLIAGLLALILLSWSSVSATKDKDEKEADRIQNAATVLKEVLDMPDGIPQDLIDKARCVIVFPSVVKAAFIVGGSYGRGVMVCRSGKDFSGPWGAPTMMALEAGSVGFQIGGQATDFVILVMNPRGVESLLHNKVKLGADASIAAGPKGRDAQAATDAAFRSEMLSYSRARGVFAGVSLEGSTLRPDNDANRRLYGRDVNAEQIISESKVEAPPAAHELIAVLQKASPHLKQ